MVISSPLGPKLANVFLVQHKKIGKKVVLSNIDNFNRP